MILFVGDKPSPRMKPGAKPFEGASCEARLGSWIAAVLARNQEHTTYNKGDIELAGYMILSITFPKKYVFIALGNAASASLDRCYVPHFKLPHPSGRNRQINNKSFIEAKLAECKKYIEDSAKV